MQISKINVGFKSLNDNKKHTNYYTKANKTDIGIGLIGGVTSLFVCKNANTIIKPRLLGLSILGLLTGFLCTFASSLIRKSRNIKSN